MNFKIFSVLSFLILLVGCAQVSKIEKVDYSRAELKKRTFNFFWERADSANFQIPDRYPTKAFSSIAATGFGLSSYLVGIENKYITRTQGAERVLSTLKTLYSLPQGSDTTSVSGHKGFFYHFLNTDNATRFKNVELSSIDTGLLMAGVLSCMTYFDNPSDPIETEIRKFADDLFKRVEWNWMVKTNGKMSMGWHPENGFIESEWAGYNEAMILLVMAMGSPTYPLANDAWAKWCETYPIDTFYGQTNIQFDPLFGHQYSHIWIDFRGINDEVNTKLRYDYHENSRRATLSNRDYCIANPSKFVGYGENQWGLTACDGPKDTKLQLDGKEVVFFGYRARGAASLQIIDDGTIAPTAAGGSFVFTPYESEKCMEQMWNTHYDRLIGEYGFKDAFNLTYKDDNHLDGWFDIDYLGIDQGPILLQIQNHETQLIWNIMKRNPYIIKGLQRAGFKGGWLDELK